MRNKKIFKRLMAAVLCSALLATAPTMTYATQTGTEVIKTSQESVQAEADENGFIIKNGVLIQYTGNATEVTIPDGIVTISEGVFRSNSNITKVVIPEGVTKIGRQAFRECSNLAEVQIPNSVTWIGNGAFRDTAYEESNGLVIANHCLISGKNTTGEVVISEGVTVIAEGAFSGNDEITKVTIPEGVTTIEREIFMGCDNLEEVILPPTVTRIVGDGGNWFSAFQYCEGLKRIEIPEGVTVIEFMVFEGCSKLSDIKISSTVTEIESYAFWGCESLTSLVIPEGVTTIGSVAFGECIGLKSVTIPKSVTSIGENVFTVRDNEGNYFLYDVTLSVVENSYAHQYALDNGIKFVLEGQADEDNTPTDVIIANDKTGIPDKNLYTAILAQAESLDNATKDGKLTVSEAEALRNLELNGLAISDLTGLDYCKNLYWVNLEDNQVSDISVFGKMPEIIGLVLDNNKVSDISPLKNFDGFSTLSLANNPIKDYSTLAGKHMDLLDLSNNNITDISFITTFRPAILYLKNNNISDISALSSVEDIYDWDLSGNQISDISVLANASFSTLNLSNNKISDVSPLAKQENIFAIDLSNNNIRDISPLLNVEFLFLNVSNNNIRDLGTLADNVKERFVYDGNPIGEKETYTEEQFDKLLGENSTADVVIESSDKITITFEKGTMKEVDGVTNYDFTATTTTDYASSKLLTSVKADEFVLKISYNYSGNLPAEASVEIFVGKEYAKKDLYYSLLKDDGTLTETQKATVDAEGYMTVKQSHCSDWVITTTNPVSETPNGGTEGNTSSNGDSSDNKIDSPNTGDSSVLLSNIALVMAAALLVLYKKIKKA